MRSEDAPIRQHQAAQQVEIVAAWLVADIDGAPAEDASRGVQQCGRVLAVEHVPVRLQAANTLLESAASHI